jgi:hypothetical protein
MRIKNIMYSIFFAAIFFTTSCNQLNSKKSTIYDSIRDSIITIEKESVIELADRFLDEKPITVTASRSERSAGGPNDYYSEGTYWWPNPDDPSGPFIRKDGIGNPDNFNDHLTAMKRLSMITGTLTSAYLLTGEIEYAEHSMKHMKAWFVDSATMMNPHLLYSQAIQGIVTGRGIGIIDAVQLIDVAKSADLLSRSPKVNQDDIAKVRSWFKEFTTWLKTHPYGIEEMNWKNNHSTWWHAQVATYASFTKDQESLELTKKRMKEILIPNQMAPDGSFPEELERTRPFGYSVFNIEGMVILAHVLSNEDENMWKFMLDDGRGVHKAVDYIHHHTKYFDQWPYSPDTGTPKKTPYQRPYLLLASLAYENTGYFTTWKNLPPQQLNDQGIRNIPIKNIILWIGLPDPLK